jgi:hypothetical protein
MTPTLLASVPAVSGPAEFVAELFVVEVSVSGEFARLESGSAGFVEFTPPECWVLIPTAIPQIRILTGLLMWHRVCITREVFVSVVFAKVAFTPAASVPVDSVDADQLPTVNGISSDGDHDQLTSQFVRV